LSSGRILVIDDDRDLCEELSDALGEEGYSTEAAWDVARAKDLIIENGYDVVLLDFKMPGDGGIGILRIMKEKKIQAKVLLISGRPFVEDLLKEAGLLDAVSVIIPKPIAFETLLEAIRDAKLPPGL
jgi:two-component system OmpR family response regulator